MENNQEELQELQELNKKIIELNNLEFLIPVHFIDSYVSEVNFIDYFNNKNSVKVFSKFIQVETCQTSAMIAEDLHYDIDQKNIIKNVLLNETSSTLVKNSLNKIKEVALYLELYNFWDKILSIFYKIFKKKYEKIYKIKNSKDLIVKILYAGNIIMEKSRIGLPSFIICSSGTANYLSSSSQSFVIEHPKSTNFGTITLFGKIAGTHVLVDNNMKWDDNTIIIGRKSEYDKPGIHLYFYNKGTAFSERAHSSIPKTKQHLLTTRWKIVNLGEHPEYNYIKFKYKK